MDDPDLLRTLAQEVPDVEQPAQSTPVGVRLLDESPAGTLSTSVPRGKYGEFAEPDEPGRASWTVEFHPSGGDSPLSLMGHSLPAYAGVLFPDGRTCATAGQGRVIRIWDLQSASQRFLLRGHTDTILALAVCHDPTAMVAVLLARPHSACMGLRARHAPVNLHSRPIPTSGRSFA